MENSEEDMVPPHSEATKKAYKLIDGYCAIPECKRHRLHVSDLITVQIHLLSFQLEDLIAPASTRVEVVTKAFQKLRQHKNKKTSKFTYRHSLNRYTPGWKTSLKKG